MMIEVSPDFTHLKKRTSNNTHRQNTTVKILEHRGEAEALPCTTETEMDYIRRVRGAATCWLHCLSLRPAQHWPRGLPWASGSSSGKGRPGWTSSSPSSPTHIVGGLLGVPLQSCLMGIKGQSAELDHWESDCDRGGGRGLQQPAFGSWQTEFIFALPSNSPNQQPFSSVEPRWWHSLTKELRGVHICLIWDLKDRTLSALEPGMPICPGRGTN